MGHELLVECFESVVVEGSAAVFVLLGFDSSQTHDDALFEVDSLLPVSHEVVAVVYLVDALAVFEAGLHQFLHHLDALLLEFCQKAEEFEPIVALQRIVGQPHIAILPQSLESSHVLLDLFLQHGAVGLTDLRLLFLFLLIALQVFRVLI